MRRSLLVFGVLLVHSLPEGFAIGTAFASDRDRLALFVILAIALQNVPEGTSVAIPMDAAGFGRAAQFWAAVITSAPQPVGALVAGGRSDARPGGGRAHSPGFPARRACLCAGRSDARGRHDARAGGHAWRGGLRAVGRYPRIFRNGPSSSATTFSSAGQDRSVETFETIPVSSCQALTYRGSSPV